MLFTQKKKTFHYLEKGFRDNTLFAGSVFCFPPSIFTDVYKGTKMEAYVILITEFTLKSNKEQFVLLLYRVLCAHENLMKRTDL